MSTSKLLSEAAALEGTQHGPFTTALSDGEVRYLEVMAELFARGALPGLAGGEEGPCAAGTVLPAA